MKNWFFFLRIGIAVTLYFFLVYFIGLTELFSVIKSVSPVAASGLALCMISLFFLGAFNIWLLLNAITPITFSSFLKVYTYSWVMSLVVPGQAGDASIILLLKKQDIPYQLTGAAYLFDKLITLLLFLGISLYGCSYLFQDWQIYLPMESVWIVVFLLVFSFLFRKIFAELKWFILMKTVFNDLLHKISKYRHKKTVLAANITLTVAKWILVSLAFYMAFLSFGVKVAWPHIGVIPILSTLVGYIPISIAGIGTVEVTAVYLFKIIGITNPVVLSAYLFMRCIQYTLAISLMLFIPPN